MRTKNPRALSALLRLLPAIALAAAPLPGAAQDHGHDHDHGADHDHRPDHLRAGADGRHDATARHAFDDVERWVAQFENPERDAWQKPDRVVAHLVDRDDLVIADIGSATGYFPVRFAAAVPKGFVIGADIEPGMVQYLNARAAREGLDNLVSVEAAPDDPRLPRAADLVFFCNTYHHIDDRITYLRRLTAQMTPGGRIAVVDFRPDSPMGPPHKLAPEIVREEMAAAGFEPVAEHDDLPEQYFLVYRTPLGSDPEAVELARATIAAMGGQDAWDATRYLRWNFFDKRRHTWDKWTGDSRVESGDRVTLFNVNTRTGRCWDAGTEVSDPDTLAARIETAYAQWVNDSYWLVMPYKMLDPGVTLRSAGESVLPDGRAADVVTLTFAGGTGLTPRNRYDVWIARDTGLVEQWAFYRDAADPDPAFTGPWSGWREFGRIRLATSRGRGYDWDISVPDQLPREIFQAP